MRYKEWKAWLDQLPWTTKWFVILILVRPLIDTLYFLKEISPLLSPLNIVGVLTPLLILVSFVSPNLRHRESTPLDFLMTSWAAILMLNCILIVSLQLSLESIEIIIKLVTPLLIYFYLRRLIRSKRDFLGVLTTFLYSTSFPFGMLLYEHFIGPIGPTVYTRGHERFEGLFADVMSYATYVIGALLIASYFFLEGTTESFRRKALRLGGVGMLALLGLVNMHHTASWMVAAVVVFLLCFYSVRQGQLSTFVFMLFLVAVGCVGFGETINERLGTSLQTDIAVLEGEKNVDRAFHGRVWRWKKMIAYWDEKTVIDKLLGISFSARWVEYNMLGSGIHNDYMRIICVSGLAGFALYVMYYILLFFVSFGKSLGDQYLIQGGILVMLMYSVTTTPTMYLPLLNLAFAVFAYAALPSPVYQGQPQFRPVSRASPLILN